WALDQMWLPVRDVMLSIFGTLVILPISLLNSDVDFAIASSRRKSLVTGNVDCAASGFADASKNNKQRAPAS
ncbi:MAG: hypothetical protein ACRDQ7_11485, partial [Haloechinothrix sp.]